MVFPRWKKILSDLWSNKARTLLVALSIAVGIFAVGSVSGVYFIMREDVPADYQKANPHSGILYTDLFDDDLLVTLRRTEGVKNVEGRSGTSGMVTVLTGEEVPIRFTNIAPLDTMQIDKLVLVEGKKDLADKEIYIEQTAKAPLGVEVGDILPVTLDDGRVRELRVAGFVHDVNGDSYTFSRQAAAYANGETVEWLGGTRLYNQVLFVVSERPNDELHVQEVAKALSEKVTRGGREVYVTVVFRPGEHPAQSILDSVFALLGGMGVLALLLSTFLVINTISSLMGQQIRQIGVMKAVGGTFGQVSTMYLVLIGIFGIIALIIAVPISGAVSYISALGIGQLLNIHMGAFRIPTATLVLEILVGIAVPLFAGLVPVFNGARLTVREAISSYGLANSARGWFDRMLEQVRGLPRPLLLSLRNTFRRKARLFLTLSTLILGGAMFIAVFNVRDSLYKAIDVTLGYVLTDVNVAFQRSYRTERVNEVVNDIPGVVSFEGWGDVIAQMMSADGETSDQVEIIAPPSRSQLIKPVLTSGRWLVPEDENAVVVGNHFIKLRPDVEVGDEIIIQVDRKEYPFQVVGIYQMAGTVMMPVLYVNSEYMSTLQSEPGQMYSLRVVTDRHDAARQQEVADALKARFEQEGFAVAQIMTGDSILQQNMITINVLVALLLFMAILIAIVGGLGLMGTMGMNVLERTREIGVMRSIGAVNGAIMQLVIVEGMVIGVISWALGALLSIPIAKGLGFMLGVALLNVPLEYQFSLEGLVIWVFVVLVLSTLACILPARNAVRLTVRDVLAYE